MTTVHDISSDKEELEESNNDNGTDFANGRDSSDSDFYYDKMFQKYNLMNTLNHYPLNFTFLRFPCAVF